MSEENTFYTNNEPVDPSVAQLADEESIINNDLINLYEQAVKELSESTETFDESYIKISKPKEMPETDENNVIGSSGTEKLGGAKKSAIVPNQDGIISSGRADSLNAAKPNKPKKQEKKETIAVYSTKNVTLAGIGKVYRGYNIVDKDAGEKWLERDHIRLATPEEIKEEFGK
jgi:hypothetical protein